MFPNGNLQKSNTIYENQMKHKKSFAYVKKNAKPMSR